MDVGKFLEMWEKFGKRELFKWLSLSAIDV